MRVINFLVRNSRNILVGVILFFKGSDWSKKMVIFSESRGGSTWLMEMLCSAANVCVNWEPLHSTKGVVPSSFKFGSRPFIPKFDDTSDYKKLFKRIHEYKIHSFWTRKYLADKPIAEIVKSKFVLTKYVRANLLVPFILQNEHFDIPPILLVRHPIDTCLSQKNAFKPAKQNIVIPNCINPERYDRYIDYINNLESALERRIAMWCLNNCSTLNNLKNLRVTTIYYSNLLLEPEKELQRVLESARFDDIPQRLKMIKFRTASSTNFGGDYISEPKTQLMKNFTRLENNQKESIQKIFDHFEFTLFTAFSPYPQIEQNI